MVPQSNLKNVNIKDNEQTNLTFGINFNKQECFDKINNVDALKQAIYMILNTNRYENIIYSFNYGCELLNVVGEDFDFVKSEAERYIREAVLSDSRFEDVTDFLIEKKDNNTCTISFNVITAEGVIPIEKEVNT